MLWKDLPCPRKHPPAKYAFSNFPLLIAFILFKFFKIFDLKCFERSQPSTFLSATALIQYLRPLGAGPSGKHGPNAHHHRHIAGRFHSYHTITTHPYGRQYFQQLWAEWKKASQNVVKFFSCIKQRCSTTDTFIFTFQISCTYPNYVLAQYPSPGNKIRIGA